MSDWIKAAIEAGGGEQYVSRVMLSYASMNRDLIGEGIIDARTCELNWRYDDRFLLVTAKKEKRAIPFSAIGEIRFREG